MMMIDDDATLAFSVFSTSSRESKSSDNAQSVGQHSALLTVAVLEF